MRVLDHVALNVSDYERSRAFYVQALAPLGVGVVMELPEVKGIGLGEAGKPYLWITERGVPCRSTHVALAAADTAAVDAFYAAAIAAGGKDNGPPGLRTHYHPSYYGAFVHDLDGHNIEACVHKPE